MFPMHGDTMNARETQNIIETILFRRALEHKLEGYTLETSVEISEALKSDKENTRMFCRKCKTPLQPTDHEARKCPKCGVWTFVEGTCDFAPNTLKRKRPRMSASL